jgi:DNA-binding beta-propeller fold protein YncE
MYHYFSPQGMALSPDGSRLFVYNYITTNPYQTPNDWLTVLNATTLRRQSVRIKLPGCDAEQMTTTHDRIVVLCYGSEDLRFVDPNTETVVRRVLLPFSGSSMVASADGGRIFVAGDTGEFTSIGTKRGGFTRTLNYQPQFGAPVGPVQVAVSGNGRYLFVGIARATSGTALYTNVIQLPSLKLQATLKMQPSLELASAPSGFYEYPKATAGFPVGPVAVIQRVTLTTQGATATSLLSLPGQVYFFATPT